MRNPPLLVLLSAENSVISTLGKWDAGNHCRPVHIPIWSQQTHVFKQGVLMKLIHIQVRMDPLQVSPQGIPDFRSGLSDGIEPLQLIDNLVVCLSLSPSSNMPQSNPVGLGTSVPGQHRVPAVRGSHGILLLRMGNCSARLPLACYNPVSGVSPRERRQPGLVEPGRTVVVFHLIRAWNGRS